MDEDGVLIKRFAREGSERAFSELVDRHIGLVYSAALRQLSGDPHRAEDATQIVFCELAASADRLANHSSIAGWLYNTARFVAARLRRAEVRRTAREMRFQMDEKAGHEVETLWSDIAPFLDDAMQELPPAEREALVLRFFQNHSLGAIGALLHTTEDAARMRVNRALEKLRLVLQRRGVTSSGAVLGGLLTAHAITTPPAAFAATVAGSAMAAAAGAAGGGMIIPFMASAKIKVAAAVAACATLGTGFLFQAQKTSQLRTELRMSQAKLTELEQVRPPADSPAQPNELQTTRAERSELLRLRGEVTQLRDELARERNRKAPSIRPGSPNTAPPDQSEEVKRAVGIGKLNLSRIFATSFHEYAKAHNGRMPASFAEAAEFIPPVPQELNWLLGMTGPDDFEITYQGSLTDLAEPSRVIIAREKKPFDVENSGAAKRTYIFADGHSEIHRAPTGDFESWERNKMIVPSESAP